MIKKILAVILTALTMFTFTACKKKDVTTTPDTAWNIESFKLDTDENGKDVLQEQKVGFYVTRNGVSIKEVWLNVESLKLSSVTVAIGKYTSSSNSEIVESGDPQTFKVTKELVKTAKKNNKGWIKIIDSFSSGSNSYIYFKTTGGITVNELVFVGTDGKVMSYEIRNADICYFNENGKTAGGYYSLEELQALTCDQEVLPLRLNDEQTKLPDELLKKQ